MIVGTTWIGHFENLSHWHHLTKNKQKSEQKIHFKNWKNNEKSKYNQI